MGSGELGLGTAVNDEDVFSVLANFIAEPVWAAVVSDFARHADKYVPARHLNTMTKRDKMLGKTLFNNLKILI